MADEVHPPAKKRRKTEKTSLHQKEEADKQQQSIKQTAKNGHKDKDIKKKLTETFKVELPQDFFLFWEFCMKLNSENPSEALNDTLGLKLVGPYDILSGAFDDVSELDITSYHLHWRYFYDPPEFLTVVKGDDKTGYHLGYYSLEMLSGSATNVKEQELYLYIVPAAYKYLKQNNLRDDPNSSPVFVASNEAEKSCEFTVLGENLFAALNKFLEDFLKTAGGKSKQKSLKKLQASLISEAKTLKCDLGTSTPAIKARNKKVVSKTFHKVGIVVPVDANDVGYRPLTVTDAQLKNILKRITEGKNEKDQEQASEDLQEIMTLVQFANDECDYGMGLELGLDLFCFGSDRFHNTILQLMPLAYRLLGKDTFAEIAEIHVNNRTRAQLSQLPS